MQLYRFLICFALFTDAFVHIAIDEPRLRRSRRDLISWNRQVNRSRSLARNRLGGNAAEIPSLVDQFSNFYRQNSGLLPTGSTLNEPELLRLLMAEQNSIVLTDEEIQLVAAFIAAHFM